MAERKFSQSFIDHQFKPGQSGCPAGLPKGYRSLTEDLKQSLDKSVKINRRLAEEAADLGLDVETATVRELLVMSTLIHAINGVPAVLQHVWDRIDGKVADRFAGHDGGPLAQDVLTRVLTGPELSQARELARRLHHPGKGTGVG